jgi:hypothetical protein
MSAYGLAVNDETLSHEENTSDRPSHVQLVPHSISRAPWVRQRSTLLEQVLEEHSLAGVLYVVEDITSQPEASSEGSFDAMEVTLAADGEIIASVRAKCVLTEYPLRKRRSA